MTEDEIIDMAMKAEFVSHGKPSDEESELFVCVDKDIYKFAALVAAKEREACAKLCETEMRDWYASQNKTAQSKIMLYTAVYDCAAAIRARGQE